MDPNSSCRLIAVNLLSFVDNPFTERASVDFNKLYEVYYEATRLGDDLVDLELEYIQRIIDKIKSDPEPMEIKERELKLWEISYKKAYEGRRMGIGLTALGDTLAALGVGYGSKESFKVIKAIMMAKEEAELDSLTDLAVQRGPFTGFDKDKEFLAINGILLEGKNLFYQNLLEDFPHQAVRMHKYGRRSVSWSTVSPTGSVSILTQTSSGLEPVFQPFYTRRRKINPDDPDTRVNYIDDVGDRWQEYFILHPQFVKWAYVNGHKKMDMYPAEHRSWMETWTKEDLDELFKKSPWYGSCANDIDWNNRIRVQEIIQDYTSNSVSSTTNLPKGTKEDTVSNLYLGAWLAMLKGTTVYVDGSRSGVLVTDKGFQYKDAVKRPKKVEGDAFYVKVKGEDYTVFVGLIDDKPYEVFAYKGNGVQGKGYIVKKAKGHYVFEQDGTFEITDNLTEEQEAITRGYSFGLRHGGSVQFAVEQLNKTKGTLVDFNKAIARVLKKYIPKDAVVSDKTCPSCGSESMIFEEGCVKCSSCGYSKC